MNPSLDQTMFKSGAMFCLRDSDFYKMGSTAKTVLYGLLWFMQKVHENIIGLKGWEQRQIMPVGRHGP